MFVQIVLFDGFDVLHALAPYEVFGYGMDSIHGASVTEEEPERDSEHS